MSEHEEQVAAEFDRWARAGRGEGMARSHADIVAQALAHWTLTPSDHLLDLGCGVGGALAQALGAGVGAIAGIDLVEEMVVRARSHLPGADLRTGSVAALPWPDATFTHVLSVESAYYWADPAAALAEAARVLAPGGHLGVLIELYGDNPGAHGWPAALGLDLHVLTAAEWGALAEAQGFVEVSSTRVRDRGPGTPKARFEPSAYFASWKDYKTYRREGALWLTARR